MCSMPARRRTASRWPRSDRKTKEGPGFAASKTTSADAGFAATRPAKRNVIGGAAWLIDRTARGGGASAYTSCAGRGGDPHDRDAGATGGCLSARPHGVGGL